MHQLTVQGVANKIEQEESEPVLGVVRDGKPCAQLAKWLAVGLSPTPFGPNTNPEARL